MGFVEERKMGDGEQRPGGDREQGKGVRQGRETIDDPKACHP